MAETKPVNITDDEFEKEVLQADGLVVVDFWAPWCGPCLFMAPALESFAAANQDKVKVCKLNLDENPKYPDHFKIRSIPTLIFFKDGQPVDISIGAVSEANLQKKLDGLLGEGS